MTCRHCGHNPAGRPRGLCWTCYYTPGLRDRYPCESRYGHRGVPEPQGGLSAAPEPCRALPGTEEKLQVLIQRCAAGVEIFHAADARMLDQPEPAWGDRPCSSEHQHYGPRRKRIYRVWLDPGDVIDPERLNLVEVG